ncbi:peroxisome biogenesis factor 1-like [Diaphorina citri]|uniref:Peroxisome biogenesis factor 1-like n=1 Tax=Diaphorina citri TaxID=121845 RepID=A0A3Q0J7A8_DIACI|nr:peroxisome biogenesis factor 1-like [Diaphorina citri]
MVSNEGILRNEYVNRTQNSGNIGHNEHILRNYYTTGTDHRGIIDSDERPVRIREQDYNVLLAEKYMKELQDLDEYVDKVHNKINATHLKFTQLFDKLSYSMNPVLLFHQLNFKHESQTDLEFCSQIDELEDVRSYDNDASIISTKNENVSDANTNHCNTKNIKDSHVSSNHKKKDTKNQSTSNGLSVEITNESNTESNNRSNSSEHINENSSIIPRQDQVFADDLDFLEPSEQLILIYLDQQLLSDLNLKVGAKFCLSPYRETYRCQKVILHALMPKDAESKNLPDIDEDIDKDFLVKFFHASYYPILNHNAILSLSVRSMTIPIRVELIPSSVKYCLYDNKIQREVQISYEEYVPVKQKVVQSEGGVLTSNLGAISTEKPFLNHLNQTLNTLVSQIRISVRSSYLYRDNILVTGAEGSGKTTFCKTLQEALQNAGPDSIHCQVVDCKQMKSKIPNVVEKYLRDVLSCACYMEPSCVILDDINILCSCNKESLDVAATTLCNK